MNGKLLALERSGCRLIELMLLVTHLVLWEKSEQKKKRGGGAETQSLQMLRSQWQDADRALCGNEH